MPKIVVLDFDGTLTDPWKNADKFGAAYEREIENYVGKPIRQEWKRETGRVLASPERYGFEWNGKLTSAATDPYLIYSSVAALVLKELGKYDANAVSEGYRNAYASQPAEFKPDAAQFIRELQRKARVVIITNSKTDKISTRMQNIDVIVPVYGDAAKFKFDTAWDAVPEAIIVDGLDRPVQLRRKSYYDALERVLNGAIWPDLLVVGDSYELDLALPSHLGAHMALIDGQGTLEYERKAASKNGIVTKNLGDVLDYAR